MCWFRQIYLIYHPKKYQLHSLQQKIEHPSLHAQKNVNIPLIRKKSITNNHLFFSSNKTEQISGKEKKGEK